MKHGLRRGFLLLIATLVIATLAVAAHADTHPEQPAPVLTTIGTAGPDRLHGQRGPDVLFGKQGADVIWTGESGEFGDADGEFSEYAYGGSGNDHLRSWSEGQAPAYLDGGPGNDECKLSPNDVAVHCETVTYRDGEDRVVE